MTKLALTTLAACLVLAAAACSKQKSATTTPSVTDRATGARSGGGSTKKEVADGDLEKVLTHLQRVHFAYDSSTLQPKAREALQAAAALLEAHPEVSLYIDGHADQRGTTEYNIGLGDRRARTVIDYLSRLGIAKDRLQAVSFGSERPLRDGEDAVAHATNRRVEFRLMRGNIELVLDDGLRFDDGGTPIAANR